ncbi:hypothetical protein ACOSQ3_002789 [Xanthoceras sorbifolium]
MPSFTWRSILWGRDVLLKCLRWKICNGESVRVYEDIFTLRACKEILPTNLNLSKKGIYISHLCSFYGLVSESSDHALWGCSRLKSICFINDFLAANLPSASSPFCSGSGPDLATFSFGWKAPPAAVFKLNVDASCDVLSGCSGLEVAVRNAYGIAVFAAAVPLKFCGDVEVAEAKAILAGIQLAAKRGLLPLLVETNSLNVSHLCNGDLLSRSDIENIIFDIQSLMSSLNIVYFSFISRLGNGVAYGIAKRAFDLDVPCLWTCSFPV